MRKSLIEQMNKLAGEISKAKESPAPVDEALDISKLKTGDKVRHPNYIGVGTVTVDKDGVHIAWGNGDESHPSPGAGMLRQMKMVEWEAYSDGKVVLESSMQKDLDKSKPIVISGLRGVNSKQATKKFKNWAAYEKWMNDEDGPAGDWSIQYIYNESAADSSLPAGGDTVNESSRSVSTNLTEDAPAKSLGDLKAGTKPRLLQECGPSMAYEGYAPMSFEDKIRAAISQIKYAVQDEAMRGLGDDGRTMRPVDYSKEKSPWEAMNALMSEHITVDGVKQLLPLVKDVLNKYLE
jgi:hypothetical protein